MIFAENVSDNALIVLLLNLIIRTVLYVVLLRPKSLSVLTCSNNHLYKTTTHLRQPMLSLPKEIPIQSLLYKMTTCLTRPATTFFVSQMEKNYNHYKTLPSEEMGKKHKAAMLNILLYYNAKFV